MPKLVYQDPESGQEVTVELGEELSEVTIGRNPGNVVRVNNPSISRQHAKVVYENGQCTLVDLDSSNGSYINGNRIRSQVLVDGDRIRVGEFPVDFIAAVDGATAEVDKDVIDSVLRGASGNDGPPANGDIRRQTALGGFEADQGGGPFDSWDQQQSPPQPNQPPAHPGGGPPHPPEPQGDAFNFMGSPGPDSGSPQTLPEDLLEPEPAEEELLADDAILEEVSVEHFTNESEGDLDTYNAPPDEIARGLRELDHAGDVGFSQKNHDATVEQDAVAAAAQVIGAASPVEGVPAAIDGDVEQRIVELTKERDELLDLLQNRAGDGDSASKVQIERLRKERDRLIEERRNLKRQIGDLQRDLQDSPSLEEFDETTDALGNANQRIGELEGQMAEMRSDIEERDQKVGELNSEREMLQTQLADLQDAASEGAELGQQLSSVQEDLQVTQQQMQDAHDRVAQLEGELQQSRDEVQQLVADLEIGETHRAEMDAALADTRNALADRDSELQVVREELRSALGRAADLETQIESLQSELEARPVADEVDQMVRDFEDTRRQLTEVTSERDGLIDKRDTLEQQLNDARASESNANEEAQRAREELEAVTRERDGLKQEKGAFARETDYLQVERRKLDSELRDLRKQVKKYEKDDKRKKQIFAELSSDLKKLVKENTDLLDRLDSSPKKADLDAANARAAELQDELNDVRSEVDGLESDTSELTRELGAIGEERDELSEQLQAAREELEAANQKLADLEEGAADGEAAAQQVAELTEQVEELTAERDEATEEAQTLRAALEEAQSAAEEAQRAAEEAQAAAEEAQKAAEGDGDAGEEIEKLRAKLAEAEQTLAEIILERDRLEDELKKSSKKK